MSQIVIRESSDFDETSEDDELESRQYEKDMNLFVQKMVRSKDLVD